MTSDRQRLGEKISHVLQFKHENHAKWSLSYAVLKPAKTHIQRIGHFNAQRNLKPAEVRTAYSDASEQTAGSIITPVV
jgi:hypothetical protein